MGLARLGNHRARPPRLELLHLRIKIIFKKISIIFEKDVVQFFGQTKLNIEIRLTLAKGIVYLFILLPKMNYGKNAIPLG